MISIKDIQQELSFNYLKDCTIDDLKYLAIEWEIDFDVYLPKYGMNLQRPLCWSTEQKETFIKFILNGGKILPITIIMDYKNTKMEVIDGKQRMNTLLSFYKNEFPIHINNKPVYAKDIKESYFLDGYGFIANYYSIHSGKPLLTDDQKIEWFLHVNAKGTPQREEHIESLQDVWTK